MNNVRTLIRKALESGKTPGEVAAILGLSSEAILRLGAGAEVQKGTLALAESRAPALKSSLPQHAA
jgi:hypothetical protein